MKVMKKIVINPVTRVNSPFVTEVTVANGRVMDARCKCDTFRGFELILRGRDPRDASYLTERVCGICSSAHGTAAAFALEDAAGISPPHNGNVLRNLILGADLLQNHIRHFYLLGMPDYLRGPDLPPFTPCYQTDMRFSDRVNQEILNNYYEAFDMARLAHELVALLGAKAPFPHSLLAGGSTVAPSADVVMEFKFKLQKINSFINNKMVPDADKLAEAYADYYEIGQRKADMLIFGMFPKDEQDLERYFPFGYVQDGQVQNVKIEAIKEDISSSWYVGKKRLQDPAADYTEPDRDKDGAYSWVKAPRYNGRAVEGGPLSRLWVSGDYRRGVSTMDRIMARVKEVCIVGSLMDSWLAELRPGEPVYNSFKLPEKAVGVGLTGAMRGPLGHWLRIEKGRIAHYQIITPTAWNMSPRDAGGQIGPMEEALLNTPVADESEPVEICRVIRSFDPCASCATHVIVPGRPMNEFIVAI